MTDSSSVENLEHWLTLGGFVFVGVTSLLAWASGSREGSHLKAEGEREAATSAVATAAGGAVYAGMIDSEAYKAVIAGLESITRRLDRLEAMDGKLARLVALGENQDEREERERQHQDLREMMRAMIDDLKEDMARGDEKRGRRALPSA